MTHIRVLGLNFLAHGSQDLYPTHLQTTKNFDSYHSTVATIMGSCGGIAYAFHPSDLKKTYISLSGGAMASQYIGRRLTIVIGILFAGAFIPLWILPNTFGGLSAGAFWLQFGVQGAWGVIPIQFAEMSPPGFCTTFPDIT